jgi:hypothetical protein
MAEAYAQYDAQQTAPRSKSQPKPKPKPELISIENVPWKDRCAVGAARVKQMPEGRRLFIERWRHIRERIVRFDCSTPEKDEFLMMLGHRSGEWHQGDPLTTQVTLDWLSLWFTHDAPNRHRVGDEIFRTSQLRGIEMEQHISRWLPQVPPYQEGQARLLALIDAQIAELEAADSPPEPEPEPESEPESVPLDIDIDPAAREAACAYALFDSSREAALRLRYMTAQENTYSRALRNLLALRRQREKEEGRVRVEAQAPARPGKPPELYSEEKTEAPKPGEANRKPSPPAPSSPKRANTPPTPPQATSHNPQDPHSRK